MARFQGHDGDVFTVCFSPDGRRVAAGANNGRIIVWDGETGALVSQFRINAVVHDVCFTPDGRQLLSAGYDHLLHLWDVASGRELHTFREHTDNTLTVACVTGRDGKVYALSGGGGQFDSNTAQFLPGNKDYTIRLWDVEGRKLIRTFTGHTNQVESLAFAPNGRHFASAGFDKTVRVWDLETGKQLRLFTGHTYAVRSVAISPDGRYALSGGDDTTLRLWDMPLTSRDLTEALARGNTSTLLPLLLTAVKPDAINDANNTEGADIALELAEQARKGFVKTGKSTVPAMLEALEKTFSGSDLASAHARLALYRALEEIGPAASSRETLVRLNRLVNSEEALRLKGPGPQTPLGELYLKTHRAAQDAVSALQRGS